MNEENEVSGDTMYLDARENEQHLVDKTKQEILDNDSLYEYHCACMGKENLKEFLDSGDIVGLDNIDKPLDNKPIWTSEDILPQPLVIPDGFIDYIRDNCLVDEFGGQLICKKCKCRVVVDWFEKTLECQGCDDL